MGSCGFSAGVGQICWAAEESWDCGWCSPGAAALPLQLSMLVLTDLRVLGTCCCVEAVERDCSCGLGAECPHLNAGKLRCEGNAANLGAAGSN